MDQNKNKANQSGCGCDSTKSTSSCDSTKAKTATQPKAEAKDNSSCCNSTSKTGHKSGCC